MATETQNLLNPLKSSKEYLPNYTDHKAMLKTGARPATVACELMRQRELTHPVHIPDLVKLVKDHYTYIPIEDPKSGNSLQRFQPLETTVQSRTLHQFGYISEQDKSWDKKFTHFQNILQSGHFSLTQEPYESLGEVVTDPRSLFLQHFNDEISLQLMDKLAHRTHTAARRPEVSDDTTTVKEDMCDFEKREKECYDAGLHNIKQLLTETNTRIVATRAGQPYLKHVQQCQALKEERRRLYSQKNENKRAMVLQELSHTDMLHTNTGGAVRIATVRNSNNEENDDVNEDTLEAKQYCRQAMLEWKKVTKRNKVLHKLEYIYHFLCSLYNLRGRYLKSKNSLNLDMVMSLRRNPFLRKADENKLRSSRGVAHTAPSMESSLNIKGTSSIRHSELSNERSSMYPSMAASSVGGRKNSTSGHGQTSHVQYAISNARRNSILPGGPVSIHLSQGMPKPGRNRLMTLVANQDISSKVETWEDLMNVGNRSKLLRLLRKHTPPWQIPMTNNEPVKSTKDKDKKHLNEYHPDKAVNRMRASYLALKERVVKNQRHDLEKIDRERVIKFKYKLQTMDQLEPLYEVQRDILKLVSREAVRDPSLITEETIPWYETLIQEATLMGCRYDPQICEYLSKIEKFLLEEISHIPNVKEKLCLITVSLPIKEICTPHVQYAIQFVLIEILDGTLQMLEEWQNYRKLYLLRAQ